jgi:hypothetical protein
LSRPKGSKNRRVAANSSLDHIELSMARRIALAQIFNSEAYESILDLIEGICLVRETEHFKLGPSAPDSEVRASLAECRAARILLEKFQFEVRYQVGQLQPVEEPAPLSAEEIIRQL